MTDDIETIIEAVRDLIFANEKVAKARTARHLLELHDCMARVLALRLPPVEEANLDRLLERARKYKMTPEEKERQRISFAYGNTHMENPNVTREMVEKAAERLNKERADDR